MKKLIVYIMLMCSSTLAVEYGYFSRAGYGDEFNKSISLETGDRFVIENISQLGSISNTSSYNWDVEISFYYNDELPSYTRIINVGYKKWNEQINDYDLIFMFPENIRSIVGPCVITPTSRGGNGYIIDYKIIRASESAASSDSKYTASLNADGTRLAIGEQQGTNTSTRVYEYDDVTEAWEQLGDSVE